MQRCPESICIAETRRVEKKWIALLHYWKNLDTPFLEHLNFSSFEDDFKLT